VRRRLVRDRPENAQCEGEAPISTETQPHQPPPMQNTRQQQQLHYHDDDSDDNDNDDTSRSTSNIKVQTDTTAKHGTARHSEDGTATREQHARRAPACRRGDTPAILHQRLQAEQRRDAVLAGSHDRHTHRGHRTQPAAPVDHPRDDRAASTCAYQRAAPSRSSAKHVHDTNARCTRGSGPTRGTQRATHVVEVRLDLQQLQAAVQERDEAARRNV
jgi:hypothetical protein